MITAVRALTQNSPDSLIEISQASRPLSRSCVRIAAVLDAELAVDVAEMTLHGTEAEAEGVCDLCVGSAVCKLLNDDPRRRSACYRPNRQI